MKTKPSRITIIMALLLSNSCLCHCCCSLCCSLYCCCPCCCCCCCPCPCCFCCCCCYPACPLSRMKAATTECLAHIEHFLPSISFFRLWNALNSMTLNIGTGSASYKRILNRLVFLFSFNRRSLYCIQLDFT